MKKFLIGLLLLSVIIPAMAANRTDQFNLSYWLYKPVSITGFVRVDGTTPLTADWNVGAFDLTCVDMNATNFKLSGIGTLTSTLGNVSLTTALTAASGDEAALTLNYTTNKAAGNDTGLVVNQTDTGSPGTSLLFDAQRNGTSKCNINNDGTITLASGARINFISDTYYLSYDSFKIKVSGYRGVFLNASSDLSAGDMFSISSDANVELTDTDGSQAWLYIEPKINQSGTAGYQAVKINVTETALGNGATGANRLFTAQVGSVEKYGVDNRGGVVAGLTADATIQVGQIIMADAGTDNRYDLNGANGTLAVGVLGGSSPVAQADARGPVVSGRAYVAMAEDIAVTRGHVLYQSATAGFANDNAALQAQGLNIGIALYSEALYAFTAPGGVTTNTITLGSAPGWAVGDPVIYWQSGDATVPTGLVTGTVYWVKTIATAAITLSATRGGAAVAITENTGSGTTMYFQRLPLALINIR